ncbi:MAG: HNH endonuclease, partial [Actinomycetota bacterium]
MLSKEQNAPGSQVLEAIDAAHARVGAEQRGLLRLVAQVEREQLWRGDGARDTAHWLAMRYG